MTPAELEAIARRAEAAFKGPWTYDDWQVDCGAEDHCGETHEAMTIEAPDAYPDGQVVAQVVQTVCDVPGLDSLARRNGDFIAHARTDVPRLVERIRELERYVQHLQGELNRRT